MIQPNIMKLKRILNCMNNHNLKQQITTIKISLIDHIWSNIPRMDTKYGVVDAYWPDYYKSI
jgi:hypothetical protein